MAWNDKNIKNPGYPPAGGTPGNNYESTTHNNLPAGRQDILIWFFTF
jgi:hypothetical protein